MTRLLLVNPNTDIDATDRMAAIAQGAATSDVMIEAATVARGPRLLADEKALDEAAGAVLDLLGSLDRLRYCGVILAAFGDPGLEECRANFALPVAGIGEAGMAEAAAGSRWFVVVTTTPQLVGSIERQAHRYGNGAFFAGVRITSGDPVETMRDPVRLEAALEDAGRVATRDDGAEAIVIGGGLLAMAARALRSKLTVPLVEPIPAAVTLAERNPSTAAFWFRLAAEQGHTAAQSGLGVLYEVGRGLPQDRDQAIYWYRKAAEKGDTQAAKSVAELIGSPRSIK